MNFEGYFDEFGNFKVKDFDPMRPTKEQLEYWNSIFDEDGDVHNELNCKIVEWVVNGSFTPFSDIVTLMYASRFANNTKGNYLPATMWR